MDGQTGRPKTQTDDFGAVSIGAGVGIMSGGKLTQTRMVEFVTDGKDALKSLFRGEGSDQFDH